MKLIDKYRKRIYLVDYYPLYNNEKIYIKITEVKNVQIF